MLTKSHQLRKFKIKNKGKNSEGVTNDMHIELKIFPCTATNKRKEIGSENTKKRVLMLYSWTWS